MLSILGVKVVPPSVQTFMPELVVSTVFVEKEYKYLNTRACSGIHLSHSIRNISNSNE